MTGRSTGDFGEGEGESSDYRCHDAETGRNPCNIEDPREEQSANHYLVCEVRRYR